MEDFLSVVGCVPKAKAPADYPQQAAARNGDSPEDYFLVDCPKCKKPMWTGPRGRKLVTEGQAVMMCLLCVMETYKREEIVVAPPLTTLDKKDGLS